MHDSQRSIAQYVIAMIVMGSIGVVVTESGLSPMNVVFARCAIGAAVMFGYAAWTGRFAGLRYTLRTLGLTILGGLCIVANWVLFFTAFTYTSITVTTVVYQVQPFILMVLARLLLGDRLDPAKLRWMVVAFAGIAIVTNVEAVTFGGSLAVGIALALAAATLYSLASLIARQLGGIPPEVTLSVQLLVGAVAIAPFAGTTALAAPAGAMPFIVVLGVLHTGVLYALVYRALQRLPVATVSILSFAYPAVAVVCDAACYGHVPSLLELTGVLLILSANVAGVAGWWRPSPPPVRLAAR